MRHALFALLVASLTLPAVSLARVPTAFFGVVPQAGLSQPDFERMRGVVGTLRVPAYWFQLEPRPGEYDFRAFDELVGDAAKRGIRVLPFAYGSPPWLREDIARPPHGTARGRAAWAAFLRRLVRRYGPRGRFWDGWKRARPIRRWQVWNEPNFPVFWRPRPSPKGYARLLRVSSRAIRREDPRATIVTAGVAPVEGGTLPWVFLRRLFRFRGLGGAFDVVGLHPYGSTLRSVAYQVRQARLAMRRGGYRDRPIRLTELGVASDGAYPNPFDRGRRGQAGFVRRVYAALLANRGKWRLGGIDWFAWQDLPAHDPYCVFCQFAGLFDMAGRPKPAWRQFRRTSLRATAKTVR